MARSLTVLIAGGTGMIGTALTAELKSSGHKVLLLSRSSGSNRILWNPESAPLDLDAIAAEYGAVDAIVNLAGSSISKMPWTAKTKHGILYSRLAATTTIVDAIETATKKPQVLINGSAVGFYGNRDNEVLTEQSLRGDGFLSDVVVSWEAAAQPAEKYTRVAYARTGLVLGKKGALGPLRLLNSFFVSGPLAGGKDWWPWISLRDEARALAFLIENEISGPVNLVAPNPATSGTLMKALAKLMSRPYWFPAPGFAISLVLGQAGRELLLSSQKISPEVLLSSGFTFLDSDVSEGLHSALR
ncbi:TIGR01777 family oxidoreductase [uncultured Aurantimicrobium sp.]|uniref:TIGR01777 family oxidoreductase n=1 Tax=uncultured Aurantimicrobium sp. TaxID=1705357 RepID=UPI002605A8A3|nr:TIGR01777 family oxidoreductase [uncultured Aurantimicrobium sp.]